jgi:mannitol/fructose-specific phosphotransferase system IIA component (Ntr-type)
MLLSNIFSAGHCILNLAGGTKEEAFEELIEKAVSLYPELCYEEALACVEKRENQMTTAIQNGYAIPHGYCDMPGSIIGMAGFSHKGILYDEKENSTVYCIFLLLLGASYKEKHLHVLNRLAALFNDVSCTRFLEEREPDGLAALLSRY